MVSMVVCFCCVHLEFHSSLGCGCLSHFVLFVVSVEM